MVFVSSDPVSMKSPTRNFRFPSIKTQVRTPIVAARETKFKITALIGRRIEPVNAKSNNRTVIMIQPRTDGRVLEIAF
jgi:hypothetical protein